MSSQITDSNKYIEVVRKKKKQQWYDGQVIDEICSKNRLKRWKMKLITEKEKK